MEKKVCPLDCVVNDPNKRLVILITYDKNIFLANYD